MAQVAQRIVAKVPLLIKGTTDFATPRLQTFWKYAKVELRPPTPGELPEIQKGFNNLITAFRTSKWKQITFREAAINTAITVEVACWFYIGECIGKRSFVGYQIPGAVDFDVHF